MHAQSFGRLRVLGVGVIRRTALLSPVLLALCYPFLLGAFHGSLGLGERPPTVVDKLVGPAGLLVALLTPVVALALAGRLSTASRPSRFELRARRLAYAAMVSPPLFVFTGVSLGLLGAPVSDTTVWIAGWLTAFGIGMTAGDASAPVTEHPVGRWRVVHGASAALLTLFVLFHLGNHLGGWLGPAAHARMMEIGRTVYRSHWIEPVLIGMLMLQIATGIRLAWRWSATRADLHRVVQIGSGLYLAAFIITHLNSALISTRWARGAETDWAWATGAPQGLLMDAWNIRLLPHYAFGVLFVLVHLATGLRHVLIAHGVSEAKANGLWRMGLAASAVMTAVVIGGLLGGRL